VVEGGVISLGRTGQADGKAELAGSVYVEDGGALTGNGLIRGTLTSSGLLDPGLASTPGSVLTVIGNLTSSGRLLARFWSCNSVNTLAVDGTADISGTRIEVAGMDGYGPLPSGSYEIIRSGGLQGSPANSMARTMQGATLLHDFSLRPDGHSLTADYAGSAAAPQAKALPEGFLAGMALVNSGADAISGPGMRGAVSAAKNAARSDGGLGIAGFGAVAAGSMRHNTGSHVDVGSVSFLVGVSFGTDTAPGFLTLGAFFESGFGSYSTYNSFANSGSVKGDGHSSYTGGGVLGRMDFRRTGPGHFYAEASGRAGAAYNEYSSSDLRDSWGRKVNYDASSPYYGLHLGTGYVWNVTDAASLDLYGKYFWTRQTGDSVRLSTGDPVDFESADSHRLRLGARFAYAVNEYASPYAGAAVEHEFDGVARAKTYGHSIDSPDLRGGTGIAELGLTLTPSDKLPLSIDFGIQGHAGKREGVTGNLQVKFEF
jgi:outer membrane autotransporter protein